MLEEEITIVWDERVGGFTSFQTYTPDTTASLNNQYYTFRRGVIWQHNVADVARNTFYDASQDSIVEVIFNDNPSNIKNFKTLGYEGTAGQWSATISTDQESTVTNPNTFPVTKSASGTVQEGEFVTKQGKHFAYIRGNTETAETLDLARLDVQGLGSGTVNADNNLITVGEIPNDLSIGDNIYFFQHSMIAGNITFSDILRHAGTVTSITGSDIGFSFTTVVGSRQPSTNDFFLFSKNAVAEDSGSIGFYGSVRFRGNDTNMIELFSINTEVSGYPQ